MTVLREASLSAMSAIDMDSLGAQSEPLIAGGCEFQRVSQRGTREKTMSSRKRRRFIGLDMVCGVLESHHWELTQKLSDEQSQPAPNPATNVIKKPCPQTV